MLRTPNFSKPFALGIALALAGVVVGMSVLNPATASDNLPANRMAASGSGVDILSVPLTEGESSEVHTILSGQVRLSSPMDLILRVTAECALWTDVTTVGNDESEAVATVKVWVEIDGVPVPVASDDTGDDAGKVVFCNRAYKRATSAFENDNATIETFLRTRSANAFNWATTDISGGAGLVHDIEVKAELTSQVTNVGSAQAGIGKRTLIVEPVDLGDYLSI